MEFQDELGLNLYDMDMRDYDPAIGRWLGIDPVVHFDQSTYMAMDGNPVFWADPSGADGVVPDPTGTVYGMAGQSSNINYFNRGGFGGSTVFWGSAAMQYEQSYGGHNGIQTTNDPSTIGSVLSYYSRQSGGETITWWGTDTNGQYEVGYLKYLTSGGSDRISGRYGGDGSGSFMDNVHKFLYATDQINPIALAWDGIKAKFTGSDRFGNTLTPFESSSKIAFALPIGKITGVITGTAERLTYQVINRGAKGADGALSRHIIERLDGKTISKTHQVIKDGTIIHQHQHHIGTYGTIRQFPELD